LKVNVTDWFFFKDNIELKYLGLQDAVVHLNRFQILSGTTVFIIDFQWSQRNYTQKGGINLDLKKVELDNLALVQRDGCGVKTRCCASVLSISMPAK